ncbi:hypothetical protein AVEN_209052-1, partial [Araneus ventricosus]
RSQIRNFGAIAYRRPWRCFPVRAVFIAAALYIGGCGEAGILAQAAVHRFRYVVEPHKTLRRPHLQQEQGLMQNLKVIGCSYRKLFKIIHGLCR